MGGEDRENVQLHDVLSDFLFGWKSSLDQQTRSKHPMVISKPLEQRSWGTHLPPNHWLPLD